MGFFSPGFRGREHADDGRIPPGQYLEHGFPVLSAGPTQRVATTDWTFTLTTETGEKHSWTWDEMIALGVEDIHTDIHCVTSWSKLDTDWKGVPIEKFLDGIEYSSEYSMAHSYGGYTTNVPLDDLLGGKAWVAVGYDGGPIPAEHGGPARLLVPHLYFWKSAKWVNGLTLMQQDEPGFWEQNGYNMHGDPWREERYWGS
ncbi:molybdopterin-dependent oxidoreductase [Amnibacterium flavum]|uniref:Sulfite oxidase-like oxidoreductase n=1 Tax=Amnibacterium flavum TaxID=2173173 RepID=A0A2V1HZC2_9MICO|nr:molybdopterin-dependent oxidoreductase [Amnibacterium flavum]PVZ96054.1 sulfite oxidase-like oxidoreductase [Amnibacterium flavum]